MLQGQRRLNQTEVKVDECKVSTIVLGYMKVRESHGYMTFLDKNEMVPIILKAVKHIIIFF